MRRDGARAPLVALGDVRDAGENAVDGASASQHGPHVIASDQLK
jgi:hypothetical protein